MTASDVQLFTPFIVVIVVLALLGRRMLRPRRFRVASLWIGPAFILFGIVSYMSGQPMPTPVHGVTLAAAFIVGAAVGWVRARLVRITIDPGSGNVIQQGTPYGLLFLVGLFAVRASISIIAVKHPEWGIDLKGATDVLLFFGFGLLSGYAMELYLAVERARRPLP